MPRARTFTYTLVAPDQDGLGLAQQRVGAGVLSLDGTYASGGTVTFTTGGGYQLSAYSAGNLSAVTFTFVGTDPEGRAITEAITGPNAGTVETTYYFKTLTSVSTSATIASDAEIGVVDEFASMMYITDRYIEDLTFGVNITGTINYDVQALVQNPQDTTHANQVWYDHSTVAGATADASNSYDKCIDAIRVLVNSYSAGAIVEFRVIQKRST